MKKIDRSNPVRTGFHQAKWDEPVIFELSQPGERGILVNKADPQVAAETKGKDALPDFLKRKEAPALPEISQPRVLRHYARLAQETLGADVNIEIGQGTCTVKGTERRDCADCDAFETRETALDPTNHVNTENREAVAATCTVKGREAGVYCLDCRTYVSGGAESALDPANHVNTEEKAAVAPTCTKEGREAGVYCNDCKQYVSGGETVGKLPHAYTSVVTEPTCTKGGYTTYTCQNCSDSYVSDQTAALGHTDADGNQRCDRCNADLSPEANCSCNCHKGGILGFFFKIKVFFWKLFGLTQYRYCDCGKAHW